MSNPAISIIFSELATTDVESIVEIENQSFEQPWSRDLFLRELTTEVSRTMLAWTDEPHRRLMGYICRWLVLDEIQILNLAVHPRYRRRGIGRALVQRVLDEACERGVQAVVLEVREGNESAMKLYGAFGFERTGMRRDYYGKGRDGVLMSLRLESERT